MTSKIGNVISNAQKIPKVKSSISDRDISTENNKEIPKIKTLDQVMSEAETAVKSAEENVKNIKSLPSAYPESKVIYKKIH